MRPWSVTVSLYSLWIGATDLDVETVFRWTDGSILNWMNWDSGQPNNHDSEQHCVKRRNEGKWNDYFCDENTKFICDGKEGK